VRGRGLGDDAVRRGDQHGLDRRRADVNSKKVSFHSISPGRSKPTVASDLRESGIVYVGESRRALEFFF
jgi:hypothetical protein